METFHLRKLRESLNHSVQLTWDRSHLRGIREARRLLTQGLSFNEESVYLLLELLKLEGAAADFFAKRVAKRFAKAQELEMETEEMKSPAGNKRHSNRAASTQRQREMKIKAEMEEAANFVSFCSMLKFFRCGLNYTLIVGCSECFLHISPSKVAFLDRALSNRVNTMVGVAVDCTVVSNTMSSEPVGLHGRLVGLVWPL